MLTKRRKVLQYLRSQNFEAYAIVISKLGLKDSFAKQVLLAMHWLPGNSFLPGQSLTSLWGIWRNRATTQRSGLSQGADCAWTSFGVGTLNHAPEPPFARLNGLWYIKFRLNSLVRALGSFNHPAYQSGSGPRSVPLASASIHGDMHRVIASHRYSRFGRRHCFFPLRFNMVRRCMPIEAAYLQLTADMTAKTLQLSCMQLLLRLICCSQSI